MQCTIRSLMIWLMRLINSKRTWLTAKAGDAVLLTDGETSQRYFIKSVELYLVDPSSENGRTVATAGDWLEGTDDA